MLPPITLRSASLNDLDALVELENASFDYDRISRRNFRNLLRSESATTFVAERDGHLLGYALVLFHKGTSLARLYSIAVHPQARGSGLAGRLLEESEQRAQERECIFLRLEVKDDNHSAIRLYEKRGYQTFGVYHDYYEDHRDALRLQKQIRHFEASANSLKIPYFRQTTEFTCGPASLMMAMGALDPDYSASITEELQIWREATTIFMTSGHGGCSPYGLALAAWRRGYDAEVHVTQSGPLFTEGVRKPVKKDVLVLVHEDFMRQIEDAEIPIIAAPLTQDRIEQALAEGDIPIVLISTYHFDRKKVPHWVVVSAMDQSFIYIHDPDVDEKVHQQPFDCQYLPLRRAQFDRMSQFGQQRLRTGLIVRRRRKPARPGL